MDDPREFASVTRRHSSTIHDSEWLQNHRIFIMAQGKLFVA